MHAKTCLIAGLTVIAIARGIAAQSFDELTRQALHVVARDVQEAVRRSAVPSNMPCAILPIAGDQDAYLEGLLKNALTAAGLTCIEAKSYPGLQKILNELSWNERKEDMLDAATLTKLGQWKAAKMLFYGSLRDVATGVDRAFVELELHANSLATRQHLWGQTFTARLYAPGSMQGLVTLDDELRGVLRQVSAQISTNVRSVPRLTAIRTIAVIPLAGDIDGYITGLAQDALSQAGYVLKDLNVPTRAEAAALLRTQPPGAAALLYGAVRDLARRIVKDDARETVVRTSAELQLRLQAAGSDEIIWSETLNAAADQSTLKPVPPPPPQPTHADQLRAVLREYPRALPVAAGGLVVSIILALIVRGATRVR
jgi:hypothetical protein